MLFPLPAFINHSAVTNVSTIVVGSSMLVRAARPLLPGTELAAAYFDVTVPAAQRARAERALGFEDASRRGAIEARPGVAEAHAALHGAYEHLAATCLDAEVCARNFRHLC
jgi:hypothetical protein